MIHPKRPEEEPTRKALAPWTGFESLRKEMERFFDRFGGWEFPELRSLGEWSPNADFCESKDGYGVKAEHGPARSEWNWATMKRRERFSIVLTTAEKRKGLSHDTGDQED